MCVARICLSLCGSEQVSVCASGLEHSEADFTGSVLKKTASFGGIEFNKPENSKLGAKFDKPGKSRFGASASLSGIALKLQ